MIAKIFIQKGTELTDDVIAIKRPGTGLEPKYLNEVIGKKVKKDISENGMILMENIE